MSYPSPPPPSLSLLLLPLVAMTSLSFSVTEELFCLRLREEEEEEEVKRWRNRQPRRMLLSLQQLEWPGLWIWQLLASLWEIQNATFSQKLPFLVTSRLIQSCHCWQRNIAPPSIPPTSPSLPSVPVASGGVFCLHHLRQLVWWQRDILLVVTCQSHDLGDCIVELTMERSPESTMTFSEKSVCLSAT